MPRANVHVDLVRKVGIGIASGVSLWPALAQAETSTLLDAITVLTTRTQETAISSLSAVSTRRTEDLQQINASRGADLLMGVPGVWMQERADDPGAAINIRGLQDFGRVAVTIDGARQNNQRSGHNADSLFYLEPELIGGVDVVRGPVANINGSGAIGGVASFQTKDVDDVLRAGERWGVLTRGEIGSNRLQTLGSIFGAFRASADAEFMIGSTNRNKSDYSDASGTTIANTHSDTWTGIAKATLRPADNHEVKLGYIHYDTDYTTGQPNPPANTVSQYATGVTNDIATGRWHYADPSNMWVDLIANLNFTRTETAQTKIAGPGSTIAGFLGDSRLFRIDTLGADVYNTSRFETGGFRHALTYGVDGFKDHVETSGFGTIFTPSGERNVSGGFVQLKSNYSSWLEVIGAARYDRYELSGGGVESKGERLSPKITVGITPIQGVTPYVTYAEGYRAPTVTETLIAGIHPAAPFADFAFLPNPTLKAEVGKTMEAGLNLRFDNVFREGDAFRGKFNVFRNNVENYIDFEFISYLGAGADGTVCTNRVTVPFPPFTMAGFCYQYQNVARARLEGFEFETTYDAGNWFAGLSGSHVRGRDLTTSEPLAKIAPDQLTTTLGVRLLEKRLTLAVRWQAVDAKKLSEIPLTNGVPVFPPTPSYNLVNVYAGYQINPDILASLNVENLFNEQYSRYLTYYQQGSTSTATAVGFPQPGITFKGSLQIRFGENFFKPKV